MPRSAAIAWAPFAARVDLDAAILADASGAPLLRPDGVFAWRVLDRSPVSVRLAGVDAAGRRTAVCRFEVDDAGLEATIEGAAWHGRPGTVRFTKEVAHGHVPLQDRA